MNSFRKILQEQYEKHPSMETQDFLKLAFQSVYGPEHLLNDKVKNYFYNEFENLEIDEKEFPLYEIISEYFCRINFQTWKKRKIDFNYLYNIFLLSLSEKSLFNNVNVSDENKTNKILNRLEEIYDFISGIENFIDKNWKEKIHGYKQNVVPVHHSDIYRKLEQPAYRLVHNYFIPLLPVIEKVSNHFLTNDKPFIIAIDGKAASGKTSMSKILEKVFDSFVIHMDDFFLPISMRSENRFSCPGGNIHFERFMEEVLPFIRSEKKFSYRKFDCSKMDYNGVIDFEPKKVIIIEGSYSCHQEFKNYSDLSIFLSVDSKTQIQRIRERNGEKMLTRFQNEWIPLEEKYFDNLNNLGKTWDLKIDMTITNALIKN